MVLTKLPPCRAVHPGGPHHVAPLRQQLAAPPARRPAWSGRTRSAAPVGASTVVGRGRRRRRRRSRWRRAPAGAVPRAARGQRGRAPRALTAARRRLVGLGGVHRGVGGGVDAPTSGADRRRPAARPTAAASSVTSSSARLSRRPTSLAGRRAPRRRSAPSCPPAPVTSQRGAQRSAAAALSGSHQARLSRYHCDGLGQALLERHPRRVAELGDLAVVDASSAGRGRRRGRSTCARRSSQSRAGRLEQQLGELRVGQLGAAADVVDLARPALLGSTSWMPRQWSSTCSQSRTLQPVAVERHRARRRSGW